MLDYENVRLNLQRELRSRYGKRFKPRNRRSVAIVGAVLCTLSFIIVYSFFYMEKRVSPFMEEFTVIKGQQMMSELFSQTVSGEMKELNLSYDSLVNIVYSQDGKVQSLNTDVVTINHLKDEITSQLVELLGNEYEYAVEIPLGSITNSEFLSGLGIMLEFNNIVTGSVKTDFRSEFESGGMNQTIHRLYIDIEGDLIIIAGGEQEPLKYTESVLVGETVLIGNVPNTIY